VPEFSSIFLCAKGGWFDLALFYILSSEDVIKSEKCILLFRFRLTSQGILSYSWFCG